MPRVLVEKSAGGPKQRKQNLVVLDELFPSGAKQFGGFNRGYRGGAARQPAVAVVLTDALELTPSHDDGEDFRTEFAGGESSACCRNFSPEDAPDSLCADGWIRRRRALVQSGGQGSCLGCPGR